MTRIKNEIYEETNRMKADVSSYVKKSEANSNQELLTDQYVKLKIAQTLSNNTKMYFSGGDSVLGSVLGQVFGNLDRNNNWKTFYVKIILLTIMLIVCDLFEKF